MIFPGHSPGIPLLQSGDRLTREEFERRHDATPKRDKIELIDGVVYVTRRDTVPFGEARAHLIGWLGQYNAYTPLVNAGAHASVRLDLDTETQPDAVQFLDPAHGGHARVDEDDIIAGAPELVADVATNSASYELHDKLRVYRRNGVLEYIVWRLADQLIDWFVLRGSQYELQLPDSNGVVRSIAFPGLWLDADALLANELAKMHQVAQQGLASPEHAAFVAQLQQTPPRT